MQSLKGVRSRLKRSTLRRHAGIVGRHGKAARAQGATSYSDDEDGYDGGDYGQVNENSAGVGGPNGSPGSAAVEGGLEPLVGVGSGTGVGDEANSVVPQCCSCGIGAAGPPGPPGADGKDGLFLAF